MWRSGILRKLAPSRQTNRETDLNRSTAQFVPETKKLTCNLQAGVQEKGIFQLSGGGRLQNLLRSLRHLLPL